jgi:predicted SAM-dependent methyltransferase
MNQLIKSLFPVLLFDLKSSYLRKQKRKLVLNKINEVIATNEKVYIEIGSGPKKGQNGWLTIDILPGCDIQMNLLEKLPFPDNSVDKIYSSHFLEHFLTKDIKFILLECYRVIKPGGVISSCVPDASIYIQAYINNKDLDSKTWFPYIPAADINSRIDYINYMGHMNGEHKHMFDLENLIAIHKSCGFEKVKQRPFNPNIDLEVRDYETIYVEAVK